MSRGSGNGVDSSAEIGSGGNLNDVLHTAEIKNLQRRLQDARIDQGVANRKMRDLQLEFDRLKKRHAVLVSVCSSEQLQKAGVK